MTPVTWIIIIGAILAFLLMKRLTLVSARTARQYLSQGALVIDVRSPEEFQQRHLPGAINIPLSLLGSDIARHAPDKSQPLLLHCLSGGRSGIGKGVLQRLGYQYVFNLGSYSRAQSILTPAAAPSASH